MTRETLRAALRQAFLSAQSEREWFRLTDPLLDSFLATPDLQSGSVADFYDSIRATVREQEKKKRAVAAGQGPSLEARLRMRD